MRSLPLLQLLSCTEACVELFAQNGIASVHSNWDHFSSPLRERKDNSIKVTLY